MMNEMIADPANLIIREVSGPPTAKFTVALPAVLAAMPIVEIAALNALVNTLALPLPAVFARSENPPAFSTDVTESHIAICARYAFVSTAAVVFVVGLPGW